MARSLVNGAKTGVSMKLQGLEQRRIQGLDDLCRQVESNDRRSQSLVRYELMIADKQANSAVAVIQPQVFHFLRCKRRSEMASSLSWSNSSSATYGRGSRNGNFSLDSPMPMMPVPLTITVPKNDCTLQLYKSLSCYISTDSQDSFAWSHHDTPCFLTRPAYGSLPCCSMHASATRHCRLRSGTEPRNPVETAAYETSERIQQTHRRPRIPNSSMQSPATTFLRLWIDVQWCTNDGSR